MAAWHTSLQMADEEGLRQLDAPYTSAGDASTLQAVTGSFRNAMMRDKEHHVASLEKLLHKIHDVVLVGTSSQK